MRSPKRWIPALCALLAVVASAAPPPQLEEALAEQILRARERPQNSRLHNDLGNLLYLAGRYDEAEESYREAMRLAPEDATPRFNLALLLHETGRPRRALEETKAVLAADPAHAWAHYHAGMLFDEKGRRSKAVRHYAQALSLDSRFQDPAFNPHIIENRHADSALLTAYRSTSPAALAPRAFQQPNRVTTLFMTGTSLGVAPPGVGEPEEAAEEAEEIEPPEEEGEDGEEEAGDGEDDDEDETGQALRRLRGDDG